MHNNLKNKKNSWYLILALVMTFTCLMICTVIAQPLSEKNEDSGYTLFVDDRADLLNAREEQELFDSLYDLSAYGNIGFVSVEVHEYRDELEYAADYYHSRFGKESGTIFIIDMRLRKITVFSDGKNYKTITKGYGSTITDNVYTYAVDGDYFTCASKAFEQIQKLLDGGKIAQPMKYTSNFLLALIAALLINYLRARLHSGASHASDKEWLEKINISFHFGNVDIKKISTSKKYNPPSSSSGGSGGGGGGGSSGGGGSHSF